MSVPSQPNTIDELQQGLSSVRMTSHGEGAYLVDNLDYNEQQLLQNLHNDAYFSSFIKTDHRIRSLDSVTDYQEFVPKVHPMDLENGETEARLPQSTAVETGERDGNKVS